MATKTAVMLPPMAQFPEAVWRSHLIPEEWTACLDAWISLAEAHLSLSASEFLRRSATDVSVPVFLLSYISEMAKSPDFDGLGDSLKSKRLRRDCFFLTCRLLENNPPPEALSQWEFLAHFAKSYGKSLSSAPIERLWLKSPKVLESSLAALKNLLIRQLEAGLKGDPRALEESLKRLNHMIYASPETATFLTTGSDFLDGLVSCYKLMNPPLRKAIISTTYLCLVGLTESAKPNFSFLADQLYSLKAAADTHKAGPTNINDSLVAELVTVTPILKQIQQRVESSGVASDRAKSVITSLEGFRKAGGGRPKTLLKRKVNKGKGVDHGTETNKIYGQGGNGEVHIHQMSLISQVQDLFPDLGSGFVMKLLNQYDEDVEEVISHLLEGSLPAHLESADRTEQLDSTKQNSNQYTKGLDPRSTPPMLPIRRNVFDDDEFDQLAVDTSRLHFGRRNPGKTADDVLQDRSGAPSKAAILSALAVFDADDDERDDTYDIEDVGGTVDSATPGNNPEEASAEVRDAQDEPLFKSLKMTPSVFDRDAATRRGKQRIALKEETGMTDEAIEGWALMLSRDPGRMRRLEAKFSSFSGAQRDLAATAWRADSGAEDSDIDGGGRGRGGSRGRGGRGRGGGGRGRGSVAGPTGDKATEAARRRKEANKGASANHNRKAQNARKMARGGLPG